MAEKEGIDNNDSKASELSTPEELDLNDQITIVTDEKDTVEPLEVLQEEIVSAEAENESGKPDSDTFNEVEIPSSLDGVESEHPPKETEAENSSETTDEQKDGQSDLDEFDDDGFLGLDDEEFDDEPPEEQDPLQKIEAVESQENGKSKKKSDDVVGGYSNDRGWNAISDFYHTSVE